MKHLYFVFLTICLSTCAAGVPAFALSGCVSLPASSVPARDTARAAVLTIAEAVKAADLSCATIARGVKSANVAKACADAYDVARPALIAAESSIDAWDSATQNQIACSALQAVSALLSISDAITKAGGAVPLVITDALSLGAAFKGVCNVSN